MEVHLKKSYLDYTGIAVVVGLVCLFYFQFFHYTANIPVNDDYKAILDFLNKYHRLGSFSEKLSLIFSQSNEHRIVYDRIWTIICFKIYGAVNFNFLSFIGNLSYLAIFWVLSIPFRKWGYFYLIPVAVLVFNFALYENMTFSMATLSNNTGLLFILLSIYFSLKTNNFSYFSILFYLMAVFTVGSGLFLTVLLPVIFVYNKQMKMLWIFLAVAAVALYFYFIDYQTPPQSPSIKDTLLYFKFKSLLFFFSFLGSIFSFYLIFTGDQNDSLILSAIMGVLSVLFYLYLIKKKYYKDNLLVFALLTFVIVAAALTSVSRTQMGLEMAISSRYRLYSAIMFIGCYYYLVNHVKLKDNLKYALIICFSGVYFVNISLKHIEYLDYRQSQNYLGAINYLSGNHKLLNGFEQDVYKTILEDSKNMHNYELPQSDVDQYYPFSNPIAPLTQTNNTDRWFTQGVEQLYELKDSFLIFGKGFLVDESSRTQKIYVELEGTATKKILVFEATPVKRYDMNPYFKKDNLEYGGFSCRIKKELLGTDEYTIKLAVSNNGLFKKEITDKKIKTTF